MKLDTWNLDKGWTAQSIKSPLPDLGCQYGVLPLSEKGTAATVLIFGGIGNGGDVLSQTGIVTIDVTDLSKTKIEALQEKNH